MAPKVAATAVAGAALAGAAWITGLRLCGGMIATGARTPAPRLARPSAASRATPPVDAPPAVAGTRDRPRRATPMHADRRAGSAAPVASGAGALCLVLHLAGGRPHTLRLAGLRPERHYRVEGDASGFVKADRAGQASLTLVGQGRTALLLKPLI